MIESWEGKWTSIVQWCQLKILTLALKIYTVYEYLDNVFKLTRIELGNKEIFDLLPDSHTSRCGKNTKKEEMFIKLKN